MPPTPPKKRAAIHTLGCRLNQAESGLLAEQLAGAGYEMVPFGGAADLGIIHTCTVTREADAKSRQMVRQFIRSNPGARTVVIGCYAQREAEALARLEGVDLVLGNAEKMHLIRHLDALEAARGPHVLDARPARAPFTVPWSPDGPPVTRRMNLKIQDGCDFMCSFCVIPLARGRSRPRRFDDLAAEAAALVRRGARELVLTGVNVGDYRFEGRTLTDVADALNRLEPLCRIRIGSIELTTITPGLLERMADPAHRLVPFLHVPLQSGSDRVLQAMRRNHTRGEYLELLQRAAAAVPDIGLGADIMTGFPGETDEDFGDSLRLAGESPLAFLHVFKYSERKGAAAARLPEKTDPAAASARSAALRALGTEKLRAFQRRHLGRRVAVLFEDCADGWWTGHTENYLRVGVRSPENLRNRIEWVVLEGVQGDFMTGAPDGPVLP